MRMNWFQWVLLATLSVIWGGSFFFNKVALNDLTPLGVVFGRVALAALVLWSVIYARGLRMPRSWKLWGWFVVMGALNNVIPFMLIVWGQTRITCGLASIYNATTPIFAVLAAHFFTRDERLTWSRLASVLLGFAGVAFMMGGEVFSAPGVTVLAQAAVLMASCSYAMAGVFGRRFRKIPPLIVAAGQLSASTLMLLPLVLVSGGFHMPGAAAWASLGGLALFSSALAYLIYFRILAESGVTNVLLVTLLIPVSSLILGMLFLGEEPVADQLLGMGIIGLALLIIDGRLVKALVSTLPGKRARGAGIG